MVKNVIFDVGNVLMNWSKDLSGFCSPRAAEAVGQAIFGSGLWEELDRGVMGEQEVIDRMHALAPEYSRQIDNVLSHLEWLAGRCDYAIPWIAQLKCAGFRLFYLSNYNQLLRSKAPSVLYFLPYLDGGLFSYEVQLLKPEKEFYLELLRKYELDPAECFFIDDRQENLDIAAELGMETFLFESYDKSYPEIMRILVD